jgi:hypothetical protein
MTIRQWMLAKYGAARALISTMVRLKNWPELWPGPRRDGIMTDSRALRFRRGLVPRYRPEDVALAQFIEASLHRTYQQFIREPRHGVLVDIGTNVGAVSLDWTSRLPHICVHPYEPHPRTFAILEENVAANSSRERDNSAQILRMGRATNRLRIELS